MMFIVDTMMYIMYNKTSKEEKWLVMAQVHC